ncbi:hypothetical protein SNEBB_008912 [Seison nebaliae]|nr:hypothetical protein SNEBB_008912 [Seison nebaliae]
MEDFERISQYNISHVEKINRLKKLVEESKGEIEEESVEEVPLPTFHISVGDYQTSSLIKDLSLLNVGEEAELDLNDIQPNKIDSDLKRNIQPQLIELSRRTCRAVNQLLKDRLMNDKSKDLAEIKEDCEYCCPKCKKKFCSSECYKNKNHRNCSELFYKENLVDAQHYLASKSLRLNEKKKKEEKEQFYYTKLLNEKNSFCKEKKYHENLYLNIADIINTIFINGNKEEFSIQSLSSTHQIFNNISLIFNQSNHFQGRAVLEILIEHSKMNLEQLNEMICQILLRKKNKFPLSI